MWPVVLFTQNTVHIPVLLTVVVTAALLVLPLPVLLLQPSHPLCPPSFQEVELTSAGAHLKYDSKTSQFGVIKKKSLKCQYLHFFGDLSTSSYH